MKKCQVEEGLALFFLTPEDRTSGDGWKLWSSRFRLYVRKNFITIRVVQKWNGLP